MQSAVTWPGHSKQDGEEKKEPSDTVIMELETVSNAMLTQRHSSQGSARATWNRPMEFILSCLSYAIGLGNVWRFPYLAYRNGGGAFLIPFIIMLVFIGLPLFYLEIYVGQYSGMGPVHAFSAIGPFYCGLGPCTIVVITFVNVYYMVIVAWTILYMVISISGQLNWGSCTNSFNTLDCYSRVLDKACRSHNNNTPDDLTYYHQNCTTIRSICLSKHEQPFNGTHCLNHGVPQAWTVGVKRNLASEEYYNQYILGRGDSSWEDWGTMQWKVLGSLFAAWVISFLCVQKGVHTAGKVVYFTALFPYVIMTALFIRGVTLEGATTGIKYYLIPDWSVLASAKIWGDAASQVFYSFGIACGSLVTLASYSDFYNNCKRDALLVSFVNFFTSLYAGFAIFSVLGFNANKMGVTINDVTKSGPGLAFVAYPEALLLMPWPAFWSVSFFFMLFLLGLGSQFAGIQAITTTIVDHYPNLENRRGTITAITCLVLFIMGIPMCYSGGVYLLTLMDWNTASWGVLVLGALECVSVSWTYGAERAIKDLTEMGMKFNRFSRMFWTVVWKFIVPIGSMGLLIFICTEWVNASYEDYDFPFFAQFIGWCIGLSTLILFPVGITLAMFVWGYRGKQLFKCTPKWIPAIRQLNEPSKPPRLAQTRSKKMPPNLEYVRLICGM